jgi:hypothetical protein
MTDVPDDFYVAGEMHVGYAIVSGSSGDIAALADHVKEKSSAGMVVQMTTPAVLGTSANDFVVFPLVFANFSKWNTGLTILNRGGTQTQVTVDCFGAPTPVQVDVDGNSMGVVNLENEFGAGNYGACELTSGSNDIL